MDEDKSKKSVGSGLPPSRCEVNEVCSLSTRLETAADRRSDSPLAAFEAL